MGGKQAAPANLIITSGVVVQKRDSDDLVDACVDGHGVVGLLPAPLGVAALLHGAVLQGPRPQPHPAQHTRLKTAKSH